MLRKITSITAPVLEVFPRLLSKQFHLAVPLNIKQILETRNGKQLVIEGINVQSPREATLLKHNEDSEACPVCRLDIEIKHTDVLILSQFVRSDGCLLPRRITGLCKMQQRRIGNMVIMANKAGLMASLIPKFRGRNIMNRRKEHNRYNVYYDESLIKLPKDPFAPKKLVAPNRWF